MKKDNTRGEHSNSSPKDTKPLLLIVIVVMIGGVLFSGKSFLVAYYPYIIMILGILAITFIKDHKLGGLIFLFTLAIILPIQLLYYGVIPLHENYIPITIPYMQQMFQMFGNFHVVYYPDYPQQGDTINGYIDICDNDPRINCTKFENYTLNAYFRDEGNVKHYLIDNKRINESFQMNYNGRPIYVSFLSNNTPLFNEFVIPKPSFYQSITEITSRHPLFSLLSAISAILGLGALFGIVKRSISYFKNKKKEKQLSFSYSLNYQI